MRKNLQHITLKTDVEKLKIEELQTFKTAEDIDIKSTYSKDDVKVSIFLYSSF